MCMKYFNKYDLFTESIKDGLVVYHRAKSGAHLEDLKIDNAEHVMSLFGKAIYFSSSPMTSNELGNFIGKYEISLDNPLNMNIEISNEKANELYSIFYKRYSIGFDEYDFNDEYENVQFGEFFGEISESSNWEHNKHFYDFIKNYLGYNSFYHYSSYHTDFITEEGDYGLSYGIYNEDDITFIYYAG